MIHFQLKMCEMCAFQLEMCTFHIEMHKTADFHSNLSVSWELVTEGRSMKFQLEMIDGPLPDIVIPVFDYLFKKRWVRL